MCLPANVNFTTVMSLRQAAVVPVLHCTTGTVWQLMLLFETMLPTPHPFSSVNISVKNPGSALIRSIFDDSLFTMTRHRSQNFSFESSTRNGFRGYDISLPMYEYDRYRQVRTTACKSCSHSISSSTRSRTSIYTNTTLAGLMNATSCQHIHIYIQYMIVSIPSKCISKILHKGCNVRCTRYDKQLLNILRR